MLVEIAEVDEQRRASERDCKNDDGKSETLVVEQPIGQCRKSERCRDFDREKLVVD